MPEKDIINKDEKDVNPISEPGGGDGKDVNDPKSKYDWTVFFSLIITGVVVLSVILVRQC